MNTSVNSTDNYINLNAGDLSMQYRQSFLAHDQVRLLWDYNSKEEDYGSTSSECTSSGQALRPMSTSESSTGDDSLSHRAVPAIPCRMLYS